ncbi:MAG: hypothetical protein ABGY96_21565 [bacterium]|nr:hypothetical protein [Gammaproteobacteria bacterium]HIL97496.1 hypothetical protein [Pseudomonadales bacterium]
MKSFFHVVLILYAGCVSAKGIRQIDAAVPGDSSSQVKSELSFHGEFTVDLPQGWQRSTERQLNGQEVVNISHPEQDGILQIISMQIPGKPSQNQIRNMTNVDLSVDLSWQQWGDLSGYQYDYSRAGKFYRQWWLTQQNNILLVVFSSDMKNEQLRSLVDDMVSSLVFTGTS